MQQVLASYSCAVKTRQPLGFTLELNVLSMWCKFKSQFYFYYLFPSFFCFFTKKHELHVKWHEKGLLSKSLINLFRIETNKK